MKKILALILAISLLLCFCSCGKENPASTGESDAPAENTGVEVIDLSIMSSTLAYSEVVNISNDYEPYLGKRIRMKGVFDKFEGEYRPYYYVCSVGDATACCTAGFEFVLADENGYPETGAEITIEGTLRKYNEGADTYIELADSVIL